MKLYLCIRKDNKKYLINDNQLENLLKVKKAPQILETIFVCNAYLEQWSEEAKTSSDEIETDI